MVPEIMSKSKYREIDVKKQHSMSLGETFSLCVKGVKHRMLRSVLTLAVVVLAVAFFMFLLSESMLMRSTGRGVQAEINHERISQQRMTKFLTPASEFMTVRRLAEAWKHSDDRQLNEFVAVTGTPRPAINALAESALMEVTYVNWLESIPSGKRTVLIRKSMGRAALDFILSDVEGFRSRLSPMIDLRIPGKMAGLDQFLANYRDYAGRLTVLNNTWNDQVGLAIQVMENLNPMEKSSVTSWIVDSAEGESEKWRAAISALGFRFTPEDLELMHSQIQASQECALIFKMLNTKEIREAWAREFRENNPSTAEQKILKLTDPRAVKLFKGTFDADLLARVSRKTLYEQRLIKLERKLSASMAEEDGVLGLSGRQLFLLAISFVVCMVGISNAMLMSITERFREIATMKCLGATDSYILMQFMLEAAMQGFTGGLFGVGIGFVIATLRGLTSFGSHLIAYWPWVDLVGSGIASLVAGVLLAILASIQPSWSASRMAPMEAMRVE